MQTFRLLLDMRHEAPRDEKERKRRNRSLHSPGPGESVLAGSTNRLADFSIRLADSGRIVIFGCARLRFRQGVTPKFGRRQPGIGLAGAIERADRLEAGVRGDGQYRDVGLAQVLTCGLGLVDPVAIEKHIEVAVAEALV